MTTIDTTIAHDDSSDRIAELEAKIELLTQRLTALADPAPAAGVELAAHHPPEASGSRRSLFKLAAGAAAGGTALALATTSGRVAAADGDPLRAGQSTTQGDGGRTSTVLSYTNSEAPQVPNFLIGGDPLDANIMTVRDTPGGIIIFQSSSSSYPAALGGYGYDKVPNGVYGYSSNDGFGVVGWGSGGAGAGVLARGTRANIEMYADGDAPAARTDAHVVGELLTDANGDLWYCVVAGSPGRWQKIGGADTAGSFHAVTPFRVYDSREVGSDGLAGSTDITVSVKDARDVETYAVTTADAVPDGATAISANVVAINAVGNGFATVNPGGDTSVGAAALNWKAGQTIGNAGIFQVSSSRELSVLIRGATNIDLTIDVTGYWR
jgi:hypothetical protein